MPADLAADFARYNGGNPRLRWRQRAHLVWDCAGVQAMLAYRLRRWIDAHRRHPLAWCLKPISALLTALSRRWLGLDIDPSAVIHAGFYIGHCGAFYIGPADIGESSTVNQHATVGAPGGARVCIGRRVWIGAGATIAPGIVIGDGATIAAGAVVTKDVKPRTLVSGNPARVLGVDYDNSALLQLPPAGR